MDKLRQDVMYAWRMNDPVTFLGVALVAIVIALLACYLPARRATKVGSHSAVAERIIPQLAVKSSVGY